MSLPSLTHEPMYVTFLCHAHVHLPLSLIRNSEVQTSNLWPKSSLQDPPLTPLSLVLSLSAKLQNSKLHPFRHLHLLPVLSKHLYFPIIIINLCSSPPSSDNTFNDIFPAKFLALSISRQWRVIHKTRTCYWDTSRTLSRLHHHHHQDQEV